MTSITPNLHAGMPVRVVGAPIEEARAAMILLHGRGASAEDILTVAAELNIDNTAFLAPQAARYTWYPQRFTAPLEENEPWLSSALQVVDGLLSQLANAGISAEKTMLVGFSQGACLALEYAARFPRHFGGLAGLSGAIIGPPGLERRPSGSLAETPVFLGCSDVDPHIPLERVEYSAKTLEKMQAQVSLRIYPGMGHVVNRDEVQMLQQMAQRLGT